MSMIKKIKEMEGKQKVKLGVLVVVVIVIVWELPSLFSDGSSSNTMQPVQHQQRVIRKIEPSVQPKKIVVEHVAAPTAVEKNQKAYIKALNKLQMLQLEQKISQTKQSIAVSKLAATQANQQMQQMTAPPAPPQPVPVSAYAKHMPTNGSIAVPGQYKLLYVSNNNGNWQAILGNQGKLYTVYLNTVLPNGGTVTKIKTSYIVLNNNGEKSKIAISPMM